ncbi:MAG: hypothetical protein ACR5K9_11625 [Wolbachia sp.]
MVNVKFCVEECNVFDDYGKLDPSVKHWDDKRGATWMTNRGALG